MDKNKTAVGIFNKLADGYQEKYMDVSLYADSLDLFCKQIALESAQILEIACGPGNVSQYLLKKRPDFKLLGIDLAPNMIKLAKKNNPGADFQLMDGRKLGLLGKKFEGILCAFFLPYLSKEETIEFIHDTSMILRKEGLFYISTMEKDYAHSGIEKSGSDEIFMHYYPAEFLTKELEDNNFDVLNVSREKYTSADGKDTTDLIIIARLNR